MPRATNKAGTKAPQPKYVTEERFASLEGSVSSLVDMMREQMSRPTVAAPAVSPVVVPTEDSAEQKAVAKATYNTNQVNPEWDEKAREIIGEALDHCEVDYPKNGGIMFTAVIKPEFSNAPKDYIARMKQDRRTKEIGSEGIEGVEVWCKLIKQNLSRGR